jgi:peptide deformylase
MIYPVVLYGHPVLRKKSVDVDVENFDIKTFISDMFATMYRANGVGLAAPQVGKSLRVYVIDASSMEESFPELAGFKRVFINPEIIEHSDSLTAIEEGCLSIPGIYGEVMRYETLKMRYLDENLEEKVEDFVGFQAISVQHEYDHLNGILFTDKVGSLKKRLLRSKLASIAKGKVKTSYKTIIA